MCSSTCGENAIAFLKSSESITDSAESKGRSEVARRLPARSAIWRTMKRTWSTPVRALQATADQIFPTAPTAVFIARVQARGVDADLRRLEGLTPYETQRFGLALQQLVPWLLQRWHGATSGPSSTAR